jgi:hypothetical protein
VINHAPATARSAILVFMEPHSTGRGFEWFAIVCVAVLMPACGAQSKAAEQDASAIATDASDTPQDSSVGTIDAAIDSGAGGSSCQPGESPSFVFPNSVGCPASQSDPSFDLPCGPGSPACSYYDYDYRPDSPCVFGAIYWCECGRWQSAYTDEPVVDCFLPVIEGGLEASAPYPMDATDASDSGLSDATSGFLDAG